MIGLGTIPFMHSKLALLLNKLKPVQSRIDSLVVSVVPFSF